MSEDIAKQLALKKKPTRGRGAGAAGGARGGAGTGGGRGGRGGGRGRGRGRGQPIAETPINEIAIRAVERAANAQAVRETIRDSDAPIAHRMTINVNNPYRSFASLPIGYLLTAIDAVAEKTTSASRLRVLNRLRYNLPWPLAKKFVDQYSKSDQRENVSAAFDAFYATYSAAIKESEKRMRRRKYVREDAPRTAAARAKLVERKKIEFIEGEERRFVNVQPPAPTEEFVARSMSPDWSRCVKEYANAPWMLKRLKKGQTINAGIAGGEKRLKRDEFVVGFVVNVSAPTPISRRYATPLTLDYAGVRWARVKKTFYVDSCDENVGREFYPDAVGYLLKDRVTVVVETPEMFEDAKRGANDIMNVKAMPPSEKSFDQAKFLLSQNQAIRESGLNPDDIVASLRVDSNMTMAKDLSKILVYLEKILKQPQVHIERVSRGQYAADQLVNLDEFLTLPEVFKNPNVDDADFRRLKDSVALKRRGIEEFFYRLIIHEPGEKYPKFRYPLQRQYLNLPMLANICPANTKDVVFYQEDDRMFCFERAVVKDLTANPVTGKPFRWDFLDEIGRIGNPTREKTAAAAAPVLLRGGGGEEEETPREEVILAPGLFLRLRDDLLAMAPIECSYCNRELFEPKYRSIAAGGARKVQFCGAECFEKYKF